MTLRWRLNVFVLILIAVFLAVAGLTAQAVRQNAERCVLTCMRRQHT